MQFQRTQKAAPLKLRRWAHTQLKRTIKQIALRNAKFYSIYLICYLVSNLLFVCFRTFGNIVDKLCLQIFHQTGWDETVKLWTIIAIVINLIIMSLYIFEFNKRKPFSIVLYILICTILGNIWFWVSVIPVMIVYFGSGGILR